jgi:hypothetical protein
MGPRVSRHEGTIPLDGTSVLLGLRRLTGAIQHPGHAVKRAGLLEGVVGVLGQPERGAVPGERRLGLPHGA